VHMGGKIGVILAIETETEAAASHPEVLKFADETAMQAAAMTPLVLERGHVKADLIAKQKDIFEGQLKEDPKTAAKEAQWPKMVEGKLNKWYSEVALLEQESVVVPGNSIEKLREAASKAAGVANKGTEATGKPAGTAGTPGDVEKALDVVAFTPVKVTQSALANAVAKEVASSLFPRSVLVGIILIQAVVIVWLLLRH